MPLTLASVVPISERRVSFINPLIKSLTINVSGLIAVGLPPFRDTIYRKLHKPLEKAISERDPGETVDLTPYQAKFETILSDIRVELDSWLEQFRVDYGLGQGSGENGKRGGVLGDPERGKKCMIM